MDNVITLPRRSWTERASLALAAILVAVGLLSVAGWLLHIDVLVGPLAHKAPIKVNEGLCFLAIGIALIGREFGVANAAYAAIVPAVIGVLTVAEAAFGIDLRIDELLARDSLLIDTVQPGRGSTMAAGCIALAGITLLWRISGKKARWRLFAEAVSGSILSSVGFSTLLGYLFDLSAVYNWGTNTAISVVAGAALLVAGLALLTLAWRETMKNEGGPPAWLPMPAVIGCLTLTLIFWIGLRANEMIFLGAKSATARDQFATMIYSDLDQQTNAMDRLARNGTDNPDNNLVAWQTDAAQLFDESRDLGCVSISFVDSNLKTRWVYPIQENSTSLGFDHGSDPRRRDAIDASRAKNSPEICNSTEIGGKKSSGFVIYAPIRRNGAPNRYVAAEYLYARFFSAIVKQLKLTSEYSVVVTVDREDVYSSSLDQIKSNPALQAEKSYTIFDQRVRLSLTPTPEALARDRRYLPEMALGGGIAITLLLGFTLHLWRRASSGQYLSELSNKRLVAENEERRRIEARLKVSDERLRLALDSTQIGIFEWNVPKGHVYYSPGLWGLLGYDHGRMPSTLEVWQSLIHPDDLPLYRKRTESQLNGIASFIDPEYRVRARAGDWRWVYVRSKSVLAGPNGRPTRIIGTVQDITIRRESDQALRESQAEARKLSLVASKTDNLVIIG
jgi:PAS domain S-box-containing protein